jgi:acetyl-CoA C-acetyltransferase
MSKRVYIVDGARTPFLRNEGIRGPFSGVDLAVHASKAVLQKSGIIAESIDEVILGSVMIEPEEVNPARVLGVRLGVPLTSPAFTIQRNCTSGLDAIDAARKDIMLGIHDVILCGGTEAMSRAALQYRPVASDWFSKMAKMKTLPAKIKHLLKVPFSTFFNPTIALMEGLKDPFHKVFMGVTAENIANKAGIDRDDMDKYSVRSHERSLATDFDGEIYPLYDSKGRLYETDTGVRKGLTLKKIGKMRPAFVPNGNVTAANSSQITDGSAMLILASEEYVNTHNLSPIAEIVDIQWSGVEPMSMGLGPVPAIRQLLGLNGILHSEISHVEINEAFAGQVLACNDQLGFDEDILNPHGGAVAVGHPIGASLARLTLHTALNIDGYAIASGCVGGGQGGAILLKEVK